MELTQTDFDAIVSDIKENKNGVHLAATFVLRNGEEFRVAAVDGKFSPVLNFTDRELVINEYNGTATVEDVGDKVKTTIPHKQSIIPMGEISRMYVTYDTVSTKKVVVEQ